MALSVLWALSSLFILIPLSWLVCLGWEVWFRNFKVNAFYVALMHTDTASHEIRFLAADNTFATCKKCNFSPWCFSWSKSVFLIVRRPSGCSIPHPTAATASWNGSTPYSTTAPARECFLRVTEHRHCSRQTYQNCSLSLSHMF